MVTRKMVVRVLCVIGLAGVGVLLMGLINHMRPNEPLIVKLIAGLFLTFMTGSLVWAGWGPHRRRRKNDE